MRIHLKHVNPIRKRLADGTLKTYYYHRRTRKRIEGEPGTPQFLASYKLASLWDGTHAPDTIAALIVAYRGGPLRRLAQRTQVDYRKHLDKICIEFGSAPIAVFDDKRVRAVIRKWHDDMATRSPRQADYAMSVLSAVLDHAKDNGQILHNHAAGYHRHYRSDRSDRIWEASDIDAFRTAAPWRIELALLLGLETGQRIGDLLTATWTCWRSGRFQLAQSKGGRRVDIKCTARLIEALERQKTEHASMNTSSVTILTNTRGQPWTANGFRTEWRKVAQQTGIQGRLTFHDLRGTFVTRRAEEGSTELEIAAITGHSVKQVHDIIERYLSRTRRLGDNAIERLEAHRRKG